MREPVAASGAIKPFASGGVIGTPTYFPLRSGGAGSCRRGRAGSDPAAGARAGRPARRCRVRRRAGAQHHGEYRDARCGIVPPLGSLCHRPDRARGGARAARNVRHACQPFTKSCFRSTSRCGSAGGPERRTEIVALGVRARGAQRALGAFAAALRCRLRHQDIRGAVAGDRVLRGAARHAARLSLARPAGSFVRGAGRRGVAARPGARFRRRRDRQPSR